MATDAVSKQVTIVNKKNMNNETISINYDSYG